MSAPVQETRLSLLRDLSQIGGRGRAEHESVTRIREVFHPVAEHLRALDPEVVLIVGPRGAGKSQLFKAITDAGLVPAIARHAPSLQRLPSDPTKSKWLSGYRLSHGHPAAGHVDRHGQPAVSRQVRPRIRDCRRPLVLIPRARSRRTT